MRNAAFNCLCLIISILAGCFLIEVVARTISQVESPYAFRPLDSKTDIRPSVWDTRGFWTWKPGFNGIFDNNVDFRSKSLVINKDGSRRTPCAETINASSHQVYLLGDSQTFGWGLSDEETWANHLQCALNKKASNRYRVRNFSFPGAQMDQIFSRGIEQIIPATKPGDVVIVSMSWNDLINFYSGRSFVKRAAIRTGLKLNYKSWGSITGKMVAQPASSIEINENSLHLQLMKPLRYLNPPSWRYIVYRDYGIFVPPFNSFSAFLSSMKYVSAAYPMLTSSARVIYYRLRSHKTLLKQFSKDTFANNFLVIKSLATAIERRQARLIVNLLPSRLFFDNYYYRSYSNAGRTFPTPDYMGHIAKPWCVKMDLNCHNSFDVLKTNTRDAHSFAFDGHYNSEGAKVIANALLQELLQ